MTTRNQQITDRAKLKHRLERLKSQKAICIKKCQFKDAQNIQEKIGATLRELRETKVSDGGNMYESTVEWLN